jgi:hypothetical protein
LNADLARKGKRMSDALAKWGNVMSISGIESSLLTYLCCALSPLVWDALLAD